MHSEIRKASGWVVLLVILLTTALTALANVLFFAREDSFVWQVHKATEGWLNANLLVFLPQSAIVIGGIMLWLGRLRGRDLGLTRGWLLRAFAYTAVGWLIVQALSAIAALVGTGQLAIHPNWQQHGAGTLIGLLLAMIVGTALFEDTVFRGFLIPQFAVRLKPWLGSAKARSLAALALSALIFSPWHLPTILLQGASGPGPVLGALAYMLLGGVMLGLLYLRTGNLPLAIAMHALVNAPTILFESGVPGAALAGLLGVVLIVLGPKLAGERWSATGLLTFDEDPKPSPA